MPRREKDPYANFQFKLELGNIEVAGFTECTGLQMETKVFEYKEGGRNETTLKFPETTEYGNITLKRGITKSNELINWQIDIVEGRFNKNPRRQNTQKAQDTNVAIILMDEKPSEEGNGQGTPVRRWNLIRAFPVKWVGPDLKAIGNEVAIETLEIAHEGILPK